MDAATSIGFGSYYTIYFFSNNPFEQVDKKNEFRQAIIYTPHFSAALIVIYEVVKSHLGEATLVDKMSWEPTVFGVLTLTFIHFIVMLSIIFVFFISELIYRHGPSIFYKIAQRTYRREENKQTEPEDRSA